MPASNDEWPPQFEVRESRRARHARLVVHPPSRISRCTIEVVVPGGFDKGVIPSFLEQKKAWLQRTVERLELEYGDSAGHEPPALLSLPATGERWDINYRMGRAACREKGEQLIVNHTHEDDWQRPLQRWLSRKAKSVLPDWVGEISQTTGLEYRTVTIRAQRTRWGSCSSRGAISLNRGLLFLDPELVHYLIVHELCHTRHMNHSARYWALVAKHIPHYKSLDRALRRAFATIPCWARP